MASRKRSMTRVRSESGTRAHARWAWRAAAKTRSIWSALAVWRRAISRPSIGEMQRISLMASSIAFEAAHQLPVRDAPIVLELLPACGVDVVIDHLAAERLPQHLRAIHSH